MRLSQWRWIGPIPAAFLLQAVAGLLFANGVFVSILRDPVFTRSMGLTALFMSLGITAFGILLHNITDPHVYRSAPRIMTLVGSGGIAAQILMAYALRYDLHSLVYLSAVLFGTGSGCIYLVSIVVLQEWVPESPGIAMGTGLLFGGFGTVFGISSYRIAAQVLGGAVPAMGLAGLISGALSAAAATLIQRPPTGWSPLAEIIDDAPDKVEESNYTSIHVYSEETQSLLSDKEEITHSGRVSVKDVLMDSAFHLVFLSVLATVGPGFGFVLSFPRMANVMFDVDFVSANQLLSMVTLVGVIGRGVIGFAIDMCQSVADTSKYGFVSCKRISTILLGMQCLALALMPLCIRHRATNMFVIMASIVSVSFCGGALVAASLARSIFSPENTTLVFSLLSVAIGVGRALFSMLVASCGGSHEKELISQMSYRVHQYDSYILTALIVSTIGFIGSYLIIPSKTALQSESSRPVFAG